MADEKYMRRAIELAWRGRFTTMPNPNVGCVVVRGSKIIGEGWHQRTGGPHAEIQALKLAGRKAEGSTVYITLEPCNHFGNTPPCCDALINSKVKRVVVAIQDPNPQVSGQGLYRLIQEGIEVNCGIMLDAAEKINCGFFKRMRTGLPWIQVKIGSSIDGRTAMENGESQWITSSIARLDVQKLRGQSSAILTSSTTVLTDNPLLTVRWNELDETIDSNELRQPVRVIIDSQQRLTPKLRLINQPGEIWLIRSKIDKQPWPKNVIQMVLPCKDRYLNLKEVMLLLGKHQINKVLVEAGPKLSGALLQNNLLDELIIYLAPKILGDKARGLFTIPGLDCLTDAPEFNFSDIKQMGNDLRLILIPSHLEKIQKV